MSKPTVFIPHKMFGDVLDYLQEHFVVDYRDVEEMLPNEEFLAGLKEADGQCHERNSCKDGNESREKYGCRPFRETPGKFGESTGISTVNSEFWQRIGAT